MQSGYFSAEAWGWDVADHGTPEPFSERFVYNSPAQFGVGAHVIADSF
jgi:hypothetical protein